MHHIVSLHALCFLVYSSVRLLISLFLDSGSMIDPSFYATTPKPIAGLQLLEFCLLCNICTGFNAYLSSPSSSSIWTLVLSNQTCALLDIGRDTFNTASLILSYNASRDKPLRKRCLQLFLEWF